MITYILFLLYDIYILYLHIYINNKIIIFIIIIFDIGQEAGRGTWWGWFDLILSV